MAKTQSNLNSKSGVDTFEPHQFCVVLHNDDFTTMEFVVMILQTIFRKTAAEAEDLMMRVHREGKAIAGIYSYDIAKTKALQATDMARAENYPLKLTVEEV